MNILFRVDASIWIGSGHVMRCLVLADSMQEQGWNVTFACLPQKGDMCELITGRGYEVIKLTAPMEWKIPKNTSDYDAWLQRDVEDDAFETAAHLKDIDWVVCDHYAIGEKWQKIIRNISRVKIIAIDDLIRNHQAEIIIDQTLNRKASEYRTNGIVLSGTNFALLNPSFSKLRNAAKLRTFDTNNPSVLVTMGGVDLPNASIRILQKLVEWNKCKSITVLLSERSPNFQEVNEFSQLHEKINHISFTSNIANLMMSHDIAIGAPGSTSWERACLGLPSILIPLAENQADICYQLEKEGVCLKLELSEIEESIINRLRFVLSDTEKISMKSLAICDGKGSDRVIKKIINYVS